MQYNFCAHGHLYDEANTYWYVHSKTGKHYRQCKTCKAKRNKLLYRNNAGYRERQKAQALGRYYAHEVRV